MKDKKKPMQLVMSPVKGKTSPENNQESFNFDLKRMDEHLKHEKNIKYPGKMTDEEFNKWLKSLSK